MNIFCFALIYDTDMTSGGGSIVGSINSKKLE